MCTSSNEQCSILIIEVKINLATLGFIRIPAVLLGFYFYDPDPSSHIPFLAESIFIEAN